jgi:hypothetical protein
MKAIPINIEGIQFRSKLEARWYLFMKNLGWNIEYEPEIEGIVGWIPDFLIIGNGTKVLVEVKPLQTLVDFEGDYASQTVKKIENSIKNIKVDAILLVGSSLNLKKAGLGGEHCFVGGKIIRNYDNKDCPDVKFYEDNFAYTTRTAGQFKVGVCDEEIWYHDVINNDHEGGYDLDKYDRDFIYECWNKAGSKLQWKNKVEIDEKENGKYLISHEVDKAILNEMKEYKRRIS